MQPWSWHVEASLAAVVSSAVALEAVMVLAAFMYRGVDGALDIKTLLAGAVFAIRGNLREIDTDPLLALAKLRATLGLYGAKTIKNMTDSASKFIVAYIYACHCSAHHAFVGSYQLIYLLVIRWMITCRENLLTMLCE